jgi:hypothetical protein
MYFSNAFSKSNFFLHFLKGSGRSTAAKAPYNNHVEDGGKPPHILGLFTLMS